MAYGMSMGLLIVLQGLRPLWIVPPLGKWAWTVCKTQLNKSQKSSHIMKFIHSLCFSYWISPSSDRQTVTWKCMNKQAPFFHHHVLGSLLSHIQISKLGPTIFSKARFLTYKQRCLYIPIRIVSSNSIKKTVNVGRMQKNWNLHALLVEMQSGVLPVECSGSFKRH